MGTPLQKEGNIKSKLRIPMPCRLHQAQKGPWITTVSLGLEMSTLGRDGTSLWRCTLVVQPHADHPVSWHCFLHCVLFGLHSQKNSDKQNLVVPLPGWLHQTMSRWHNLDTLTLILCTKTWVHGVIHPWVKHVTTDLDISSLALYPVSNKAEQVFSLCTGWHWQQ